MVPTFVEQLSSVEFAQRMKLEVVPVMIYGDDVTHVVTEEGIANLLLCRTAEEREQAIRGVAGFTDVGRARNPKMVESLRARGVIRPARGFEHRPAGCEPSAAGGAFGQRPGELVRGPVPAAG